MPLQCRKCDTNRPPITTGDTPATTWRPDRATPSACREARSMNRKSATESKVDKVNFRQRSLEIGKWQQLPPSSKM